MTHTICPECGRPVFEAAEVCPQCAYPVQAVRIRQRQSPTSAAAPEGISFWEAVTGCFESSADFRGRASRPEYWWFVLFAAVLSIGVFAVAAASSGDANPGEAPASMGVLILVGLVLFVPHLAVAVRRLHDIDRPGGFIFIFLIPLIGTAILILLLASPGTPGPNRYGPPSG